jgi:hypothetical protein
VHFLPFYPRIFLAREQIDYWTLFILRIGIRIKTNGQWNMRLLITIRPGIKPGFTEHIGIHIPMTGPTPIIKNLDMIQPEISWKYIYMIGIQI